MKFVATPPRLRVVALALLAAIPLMAIQIMVMTEVTWRELVVQSLRIWVFAVVLIVVPLAVWLSRGRRLAWIWLCVFACVWVGVSLGAAIRLSSFWLGAMTLILTLFWYGVLAWADVEMNREYMLPSLKWFMGRNTIVPGLEVELGGSGVGPLRLPATGMDVYGVSVRVPSEWLLEQKWRRFPALTAKLVMGAREFKTPVRIVSVAPEQEALGLRFFVKSPDRHKELRDFFEQLRGQGNV